MRPTSSLCVDVMPVTNMNYDNNLDCQCPTSERTSHIYLERLSPVSERLPQPSHFYADRIRPRSPSSSPLTKRTKLHRDRNFRKLSLLPVQQSEMSSSSLCCDSSCLDNPSQVSEDASIPSTRDVEETSKSGNLVLVSSPRSQRDRSRSRSHPSDSRSPARCPSIVQVCRRQHDHWAVVRRTRHRLTEKPQLLNLKRCRVIRTRAAQFTVHLDGAEGRAYTFEASSPELADEWVRAFAPVESPLNSRSRLKKSLDNFSDVIPEEDEEMPASPRDVIQTVSAPEDAPCRTVSPSDVVSEPSSYKHIGLILEDVEEIEDSSEEDVIPQQEHFHDVPNKIHQQESRVIETVCPTTTDLSGGQNIVDYHRTSAWGDIVIRDVVKSRLRTTSLPVLYEEEEVELEP